MKKKLISIIVMGVMLLSLCGCASTCAKCDSEIEKDKVIEVSGNKYCEECIEYCTECNIPCVKGNGSVFIYSEKPYCKDCFEKKAYPIVLEDNEKVTVSIIGYDDVEGIFAITIDNKTNYSMSTFQVGDSALLDGKDRCIGETDGSWSFAYADIPKNENVTVFSSFRKSGDEWDTVMKISEGHTFEFVMKAWIDDENYSDFWDTDFKVTLTPEMFGYAK